MKCWLCFLDNQPEDGLWIPHEGQLPQAEYEKDRAELLDKAADMLERADDAVTVKDGIAVCLAHAVDSTF